MRVVRNSKTVLLDKTDIIGLIKDHLHSLQENEGVYCKKFTVNHSDIEVEVYMHGTDDKPEPKRKAPVKAKVFPKFGPKPGPREKTVEIRKYIVELLNNSQAGNRLPLPFIALKLKSEHDVNISVAALHHHAAFLTELGKIQRHKLGAKYLYSGVTK